MLKIKFFISAALFVSVITGCSDGKEAKPRLFTDEIRLSSTPVKDQGSSPLCWAYAMLATIETEHIQRGDSVNLSPAFVARAFMKEQVDRCYLSRGRHKITLRGVMPQLVRIIETYGLMPYDSYHTDANMNVAARKIDNIAAALASRESGLQRARRECDNILDNSVNPLPRRVYMLGMEYTPIEFAHSVCMPDEYVGFTSFLHEPMNKDVVLRLPDNYNDDTFCNVPIDKLMTMMEHSVRSGHPVCWEGDVSERSFSFANGIADVPASRRGCTQDMRQREFEALRTTDDHCMAIIGIAHDSDGRKYFICKNSWGTSNPYGGMMYMSFDYARLKTIAVMLNAITLQSVSSKE